MEVLQAFFNGYSDYANYLWQQIFSPTWQSYFYWLLAVSAFFFLLEMGVPWRKKQARFRKDFWLDFFYMFFNFFLFWLIIYNAASDVVVNFFNNTILSLTGFNLQQSNPLNNLPMWSILIIGFFVRDFIQWWTHRLLHRSSFLWEFHKVHHSVAQMGFAAHLRYHWMETIVYRAIEYIPLALLGIGLYDFFIIYIFTLAVGHYNHSNISVPGWATGGVVGGLIGTAIAVGAFEIYILNDPALIEQIGTIGACILIGALVLGPVMKYLFNSPEMHIWHHAHDLPSEKKYGVNFGISLAIWDYIFGTAYVPFNGRDIKLGFPGVKNFPDNFINQFTYGFSKKKK